MKSVVKAYSEPPKKQEYPCLKTNPKTGLVILFSEYGTGMVVGADEVWKIGEYKTGWAEDICVPFHGEITLIEN